jgi:HSP20 family molecular chaperone IbpA
VKTLICIIYILFSFCSLAQQGPKTDKELTDKELLEGLKNKLDRDTKRLEKYFKKGFLEKIFGGLNNDMLKDMDKMFPNADFFNSPLFGPRHEWRQAKGKRILIIKGHILKEESLDIKVKNGVLSIEGTLEKKKETQGRISTRRSTFTKTMTLPKDVNPNSMEVQPSDKGEILIYFSIIKEKKSNNPFPPRKKKKSKSNLKPITPKKGDLSI